MLDPQKPGLPIHLFYRADLYKEQDNTGGYNIVQFEFQKKIGSTFKRIETDKYGDYDLSPDYHDLVRKPNHTIDSEFPWFVLKEPGIYRLVMRGNALNFGHFGVIGWVKFSKKESVIEKTERQGGGMRIKQIEMISETNKKESKYFEYLLENGISSGK